MHPAVIAVIVMGGVIVCWGGYEAVNTLREWMNDRREQREYEEYVRMHNEKSKFAPTELFKDDDEEDDDEEPLSIWKEKRNSQTELRHRDNIFQYTEFESKITKLSEMDGNEFLLNQERIRRENLSSKGNIITGVILDDNKIDPFSDEFFIEKNRSRNNSVDSLESWSDLNDFEESPTTKKESSVDGFESIHYHRL